MRIDGKLSEHPRGEGGFGIGFVQMGETWLYYEVFPWRDLERMTDQWASILRGHPLNSNGAAPTLSQTTANDRPTGKC